MYHRHHIIPRHMGGTNHPSNLILLTIEEHAEAHRRLYEEHGKEEDRIAWKGLLGQIKDGHLQKERGRLGGLSNTGIPKSEEHKKKISNTIKKMHADGYYEHEDDYGNIRNKISESMMGNTNSKNHNSPEFRKKQSEVMKAAWERRKKRNSLD